MGSLLPEMHEIVQKREEAEKAAEIQAIIDAENAELMAQEGKEKDRERGFWANLRTKVTKKEFMRGVKHWKWSIMEDWNSNTGFPKRNDDVKAGVRAGASVIRDAEGYDLRLGKKEEKSDLYIPRDMNSGEIYIAYRQHIIDTAIEQAETWLKTHKQEEEEAERRKILEAKLEARRKLREEQAIADEIKRIEEEKLAQEQFLKDEEARKEREAIEEVEKRLLAIEDAEEKLRRKDKRNRIKPQGQRLVWSGKEEIAGNGRKRKSKTSSDSRVEHNV